MNRRTQNIAVAFFGLWGGLGAYRGHKFYNKMHQSNLDHHNKYCKDVYTEPKHYYIINTGFMVFGAVIYATPYFAPITIGKELFTMEDYLRGRETD